jgi:periplasmic protein CpxP/Spy
MKKLFVITTTVAISLNTMYAQDPSKMKDKAKKEMHQHKGQTPEQRAQHQADRMEKLLSLSAEQKQKVYASALKKNNTVQAAKEEHKNDADKKAKLGPKIKAARETYETEVNSTLTAEQKTKWKAHREEMKEKHKAKMNEMKKPGLKVPNDVDDDELED